MSDRIHGCVVRGGRLGRPRGAKKEVKVCLRGNHNYQAGFRGTRPELPAYWSSLRLSQLHFRKLLLFSLRGSG